MYTHSNFAFPFFLCLAKASIPFLQNKTVREDVASRDDNGNATPESFKEDEGFIPDRIEEPLQSFAAQLRQDSVQEEEEVEDIPLEENIKQKVADVLGDNGVPLEELMDEQEDNSVEGMWT